MIEYEKDITSCILAAKGSGKSVMLAVMLNKLKKGVLIDMLGVFNPRNSYKTAIIPNTAYYDSVDSFLANYKSAPEKKHVIDFSKYIGEELIEEADKLFSFIYQNVPNMPVLMDEVADIMPQMGKGSIELHRLIKNGRNFGLRPIIFATQRPQSVNKSIFDLCDNFYISRQRAPKTIEYILDVLDKKGDKETASQLRKLKPRQFIKFDGEEMHPFTVETYKYAFKQ